MQIANYSPFANFPIVCPVHNQEQKEKMEKEPLGTHHATYNRQITRESWDKVKK